MGRLAMQTDANARHFRREVKGKG